MLKHFFKLAAFSVLLAASGRADLITVSGPSQVLPGASFAVTVNVSGVAVPPGLAGYLVTVNYDATGLLLTGVTEDAFLSDGGPTDFDPNAGNSQPGQISIEDVGFAGASPDTSGQLFTLMFSQTTLNAPFFQFSLAPNTSSQLNLELTNGNFEDDQVDASSTLTVSVTQGSAAPEPASLGLIGAVLVVFACWRGPRPCLAAGVQTVSGDNSRRSHSLANLQ